MWVYVSVCECKWVYVSVCESLRETEGSVWCEQG
jgi:hypothetical protein